LADCLTYSASTFDSVAASLAFSLASSNFYPILSVAFSISSAYDFSFYLLATASTYFFALSVAAFIAYFSSLSSAAAFYFASAFLI
jgi:hypothetical protein